MQPSQISYKLQAIGTIINSLETANRTAAREQFANNHIRAALELAYQHRRDLRALAQALKNEQPRG